MEVVVVMEGVGVVVLDLDLGVVVLDLDLDLWSAWLVPQWLWLGVKEGGTRATTATL